MTDQIHNIPAFLPCTSASRNIISTRRSPLKSIENTYEKFTVIRPLQVGRNSVSLIACDSMSSELVMKVFPFKNGHVNSHYTNEIRFQGLDHPNLVKQIAHKDHYYVSDPDSFDTEANSSYILMEYAPHGNFCSLVKQRMIP